MPPHFVPGDMEWIKEESKKFEMKVSDPQLIESCDELEAICEHGTESGDEDADEYGDGDEDEDDHELKYN